jgi:nicotinate-nucleotide pyrophosphorylase (carboxylating)
MDMSDLQHLLVNLQSTVSAALSEDIGAGDITAQLIPADTLATARVLCRESAVICGRPWVDAVFAAVDPNLQISWLLSEGDQAETDEVILSVHGSARSLLTAERCALNFLQTLSATATTSRHYAGLVAHTAVKLLDTRKTLPCLRLAQKYAVAIGGCYNHRIGLYDAYLIKENHIRACGGILPAILTARQLHPQHPVEVEVENLAELEEALEAQADIVMLDNFSMDAIRQAVLINDGRAKLEASGGYTTESLIKAAETGVDYISIGALTKHCRAIDLSMLLTS